MPTKLAGLALTIACALGSAVFAQPTPRSQNAISGSGAAPAEAGRLRKVNLNTAAADELRKLPRLSAGSVIAIIESRKRARFKDWSDFVSRKVVPHFAQTEIRSLVTF